MTISVKIGGEEVTTFANGITTITKDKIPFVDGVGNISEAVPQRNLNFLMVKGSSSFGNKLPATFNYLSVKLSDFDLVDLGISEEFPCGTTVTTTNDQHIKCLFALKEE